MNGWKPLTIFPKICIFNAWQGFEYASGHYTDILMETSISGKLFIIYTVITSPIVIFAIHALMHELEATTKMISIYTFFYQDSIHKNQKSQKTEKNKNCLGSNHMLFWVFFGEDDANLTKLGPICWILLYLYFLYVHQYSRAWSSEICG